MYRSLNILVKEHDENEVQTIHRYNVTFGKSNQLILEKVTIKGREILP